MTGGVGSREWRRAWHNRRRLRSIQTYRPPADLWSATTGYTPPPEYNPGVSDPSTFQLLLQDEDYTYDCVGNPTEIRDWRLPEEWPTGAKPATRKIQYDDLYRVSRVDYAYHSDNGRDTWTSPHAPDASGPGDTRRATPAPHLSFQHRTEWQNFQYDWLGNNEKTDDDAHGFYDRSLGDIEEKSGKPYQLGAADGSTGELTAEYDHAANLTSLEVERTGTCVPTGSSCATTTFTYDWDEVGRLVRARRSDGGPVVVDLRYRYDAGDQRVTKTAVAGSDTRHTVYVFDTLELRRAQWGGSDYTRSVATEVPYSFANGVRLARVVWEDSGEVPEVPVSGRDARVHVLFELGDHLGSTSVGLDHATGELVEKSSFFAYGAAESDYRPTRWDGFREDYRFTGKEEVLFEMARRCAQRPEDAVGVQMCTGSSNLPCRNRGQATRICRPRSVQPPYSEG